MIETEGAHVNTIPVSRSLSAHSLIAHSSSHLCPLSLPGQAGPPSTSEH